MEYLLHDIDEIHEMQAVHRAGKAIQAELPFSQGQVDLLHKYFHYLYGIGFHQGGRQGAHRKRIVQVDPEGRERTYESVTEASSILGVHKSSISKCINKGFLCKGMKLRYEK